MINQEKAYYQFNRGINTEASLLEFPEGYSADEENLDLQINGSRRRRRGLLLEEGGVTYTLPASTYTAGDATRTFRWNSVEGDPSLNFVVVQVGSRLHIYKDLSISNGTANLSANKSAATVDLTLYKTSGSTNAQVAGAPVDLSYGRGHAFVVGQYIEPIWLQYSISADSLTVNSVNIRERDFEGIDDGYSNSAQPASAITSHTYNLYNRGWKAADITTYQTAKSKQPAKNMIPYIGYRRATTASVAEQDWTKQFSADKLDGELWQDASAPQGHFIRNPFNTLKVELPGSGTQFAISTWTISGTTAGTQTVTITTSGNHGLSPGSVFSISGQQAYYYSTNGFGGAFPDFYYPIFSFDGQQTAVTAATNSITFTLTFPSDFISWTDQYAALGTVNTNLVDNATGYSTSNRPKAVAFFAGRVWYAGTSHNRLSHRIFFSQVIESDAQYGKCYQVADPTDERLPDLVATDGGVIVIPELADVVDIVSYQSFLLVFATNGVWAIGPGASGYFTATSYSVRKISDQGCISPGSIVIAENVPLYWGNNDLFALSLDSNSGFLTAENLSGASINTLYNGITLADKRRAMGVYDDLSKKVVWLYSRSDDTHTPSGYRYNYALVYDLRLQAFVKYKFYYDETAYVVGLFTTLSTVSSSSTNKLKYLGITGPNTTLSVMEARNQTDYKDFNLDDPEAYVVTGPEVMPDVGRQRTVPMVHVFLYKTETGYTISNGDYAPVNPSSVLMQARWNWADRSSSGKWGPTQETYRHLRLYTPSTPLTDGYDDGQPLIMTRNRVRGSGQSLQFKFTAGDNKDMWLAGWKNNMAVNPRAV